MKKSIIYFSILALSAAGYSCTDDNHRGRDGRLFINTTYLGDLYEVTAGSRADEDNTEPEEDKYSEENLRKGTIVWISNAEGPVRKYNSLEEIPQFGELLVNGIYLAEGWAGDSVSASWDARYYRSITPFQIDGDQQLELEMRIANTLVKVEYNENIDKIFTDWKLTVGHSRDKLTFEGRDERTASFMVPSTDSVLTWRLEGTEIDGTISVKDGKILHPNRGHRYTLKISHDGGVPIRGGAFISIKLQDENLVKNTIYVIQPPTISGYNFDISQPLRVVAGDADKHSIYVGANGQFQSVRISSDLIKDWINYDEIDLCNAGDEHISVLKNKGIEVTYNNYDEKKDLSSMKITFSSELLSSLEAGTYQFEIKATDKGDGSGDTSQYLSTQETFTLVVTNEVVVADNPPAADIEPSVVRITARQIKNEEVSDVALEYRIADSNDDWQRVEPDAAEPAVRSLDDVYTFTLTGLTPLTKYEYRTVWTDKDGETTYSSVQTVTTMTNKVPGGDFEAWSGSAPILLAANENSIYWDSGNHGSSTMKKNVTDKDTQYKHSGNYSAKLSSQFVGIGSIGKFAAGNAFIGKYLKTDGTDGELGWGRPFTYRPKALKGWVRYESAAITDKSGNAPAEYVKGEQDRGIIYVALLNDDTLVQGDPAYPEYPVVVKTKSTKLFDKNESNVIAYGELVLNSTSGNGMVEFRIDLKDNANVNPDNKKVAYLLLVCSASKGGDYFTGGPSTMWIDDFEFEY